MCRKSKCAYLKGEFCLLHKSTCGVVQMRDRCPDGVSKLTAYERQHEQRYLRSLRSGTHGEGCLNPTARHQAGRDVYKTCTSKHRFHTYERCREVAILAARRDGMRLAVYECPFCHGYHLTRQLRNSLQWTHDDRLGLSA